MFRTTLRYALLALIAIPFVLTANLNAGDSPKPPELSQRPQYTLRPNDLIDINFDLASELNQSVRVGPDGYISLQGIKPVYVQGQNVTQAADTIRTAYASILKEPTVAVVLKEYEKPYFLVTGEVQHPGKFDFSSATTATKAVAMAGGFTNDAKHSRVVIFREVANGWVQLKQIDLKHMLKERDLSEDVMLQPGDLIFVPKNTISKIDRFIPNLGFGTRF